MPRPHGPHGAWYVMPAMLVVVMLGCMSMAVVTVQYAKVRNAARDAVAPESGTTAELHSGFRYRVTLIGDDADGPVTCVFDGTERGASRFTRRFAAHTSHQRRAVAKTIGVFTAPHGGRYLVDCYDGPPDRDDLEISGIHVDRDYASVRDDWLIGGITSAILAPASLVTLLVLRRRSRGGMPRRYRTAR